MIDLIRDFFSSGAFIPHGHCYLWKPGLVWLHVLSDSLISLAYYSIPLTLFYFVRKRQDLPFNWVFLLFALFITACGTSHLLDVWTLWHPTYWLSGTVKAVAAIASLYTAVMLVSLVPKALALPSPAQLERANQELQREIIERQQTEVRLRQSEAALQQSEARYRAIVEDQTELICRFLPDGTLTFANQAYSRYFGRSQEELFQQSYLPVMLEEDLAKVEGHLNRLSQANPVTTMTSQVIRPNGVRTQQWITQAICNPQGQIVEIQDVGRDITELKQAEETINSQPLFRPGEPLPYAVVTSFSDISDRKQIEAALQQTNQELAHEIVEREQIEASLRESEQRFQAFMNYNPAACWISDADGRLLYVNPTYSRLFNLPEDYVPGEIDCSIHPDEFAQEYLKNIRLVAETKEVLEALEPGLLSDNTVGEFLVYKFPTLDLHGQCLVGGIAIDITERKRAEKQIQAPLKEKEILLKEIHHRVKNNLQIIYSLLRLQRRSLKDPQAAASLLDSQNRIESIALIHEKLYRTGNLAQVDVAEYISSVVSNLVSAYSSQSRHVAINIEVEPIFLDIDRAIPCGLIINELISNALKYAFPVATAVNRLDIELHTDDDFNIQLLVKDNGIGLSENFDLFEAKSLGLQLVQDFVNQLKGIIHIDRSQGTQFKITFPGSQT